MCTSIFLNIRTSMFEYFVFCCCAIQIVEWILGVKCSVLFIFLALILFLWLGLYLCPFLYVFLLSCYTLFYASLFLQLSLFFTSLSQFLFNSQCVSNYLCLVRIWMLILLCCFDFSFYHSLLLVFSVCNSFSFFLFFFSLSLTQNSCQNSRNRKQRLDIIINKYFSLLLQQSLKCFSLI